MQGYYWRMLKMDLFYCEKFWLAEHGEVNS